MNHQDYARYAYLTNQSKKKKKTHPKSSQRHSPVICYGCCIPDNQKMIYIVVVNFYYVLTLSRLDLEL